MVNTNVVPVIVLQTNIMPPPPNIPNSIIRMGENGMVGNEYLALADDDDVGP